MDITPGGIAGVVMLAVLIISFVYILRRNPNTPRRRDRVIEDE